MVHAGLIVRLLLLCGNAQGSPSEKQGRLKRLGHLRESARPEGSTQLATPGGAREMFQQ